MKCERNTVYIKSCDFIYAKISARAKYAKKRLSTTNEDIYPQNPAIASNIITKTLTKNNPYLVPGRFFTIEGIRQNSAEVISQNLCFESVDDFLWGSHEEFHMYSGALFSHLISDAINDANEKDRNIIISALSHYAPYARLSAYNQLCQKDYYKALNFEMEYDEKEEFEIKYKAITRLYIQVEEDFISSYFEFFYGKTTHKLNKSISAFVSTIVVPLIEKNIANDKSFGKTAKEIISAIINNMNDEIADNVPQDILSEKDRYKLSAAEEFVSTSFKYFNDLEKSQRKIEGKYDYKKTLMDKWCEQSLQISENAF